MIQEIKMKTQHKWKKTSRRMELCRQWANLQLASGQPISLERTTPVMSKRKKTGKPQKK